MNNETTRNPDDMISEFLELIESNISINPGLYETYNVKRGLRNHDNTGVLVGLTVIGSVHGYIIDENEKVDVHGRLSYRGVDVADIVQGCAAANRFGFEEVIYLLLFGTLPSKERLDAFSGFLSRYRSLPGSFTEDMILKAPSRDIMNKLARCVLALYSYDANPDDLSLRNILRQSFELIARFPVLIAHAYQAKAHYYDGKSLFIHASHPELSVAENFLYLMRPDNKFTEEEAKILDLCLILHAEHGGGNNSAFTTHVVSSSGTDTYSAISAAIGSLKGPKHGGANNRVMAMMDDIKTNVSDWKDEAEVSAYIAKIINKQAYDKSGLVYGFGHAVYTLSDPRTALLKESAKTLAEKKGRSDEFALYDLMERIVPKLFCEIKKSDKFIPANVDFYSGFVYNLLDIPADLYTPLFAMSRIVGWCAHRIEEVMTSSRIIRPAYKSVSRKKPYIPIDER
ncbi:MAG: citrate/2-methylcitrate synthase [Clostridiales bacterium]|jgi:citrate synthase|nr:citrate/2-methylcitrate synthase [Clostridiales bacterium]